MPLQDYWAKLTEQRVSRRRGLKLGGGLGLGALALSMIGCGGGSDDNKKSGSSNAKSSDIVAEPKDTAKEGKAGGVWKHFARGDATHFDSLVSDTSQVVSISGYLGYAKLLRWKPGRYPAIFDGSSEGESAESWELSPDKLTLTFKLRKDMKFDRRAPTNGRLMDADDVIWSWNKYIKNNPGARSLAYDNTNKAAAVSSISAPDKNTIVFKMDHPDASIIPLFSAADKFYVFPKEADGKFDPRKDIRGSGPWILSEYVPSARFVWDRNPDYYIKGRPFPDRLEVPIITDPSQQLAQFRAGNIYSDVMGGFGGFQLEVVPAHKDLPETQIYEDPVYPERNIWYMTFGFDGNSPFKDTRMRQAMSMLIDRDGYVDVIDNKSKFAQQGLNLNYKLCTVLGAGWGDYWLDPTDSKTFGDSAKYLQHNVAEAKKLMSAAGFPNGTDFDFYWLNDNTFGALYNNIVQLYQAMFNDAGLKGTLKGEPFNQWVDNRVQAYFYQETLSGSRHGYSGAQLMAERPFPTAASLISSTLHYQGGAFHGMTPDGKDAHKGDPKLNDMSEKIGLEFDHKKQVEMVHDVIRYFTQQSYYIPQASSAKKYQLWWPVVSGVNAITSPPDFTNWGDNYLDYWLDQTKAPLKKA